MIIRRTGLSDRFLCGAREAACAGIFATSAGRLQETAIALTSTSPPNSRSQIAVTAGSAASALLSIFRLGRCRCLRNSAIMGLVLAPGIRASRTSMTTSIIAMVSAAFFLAVAMWPGNQPMVT